MVNKKLYLAIPYTGMEEESFKLANKTASELMQYGNIIYSPISSSHAIAIQNNLPGDWDFWAKTDTAFIEWCDIVVVIVSSWKAVKKSHGVQVEIRTAKELGKPVIYWLPN